LPKPTLLVADADPRSLHILEVALRKAGFNVGTATDGADALRRVLRSPPDLLLSELSLPAQDGLAICRAVRAEQRLAGLPIVLMSDDKTAAAKARAAEAGGDDFLVKPILLKELVQRVQMLLQRRERQRVGQKNGPAALTGSVAELGLLDVFQSLDNGKKSAVVHCAAAARIARVWVREGQVIDAELGPLRGDAAFWRLMTWETGGFRVELGPVEREPRIDVGTQALLREAMQRVGLLGQLAEALPLSTRLTVDFGALAAHLAELPDEVNGVVRAFDGKRTLREAIDLSPLDDLNTAAVVQRLVGDGILKRSDGQAHAPPKKPSLQQWLSEPPVQSMADAEALEPAKRRDQEERAAAALAQWPAAGPEPSKSLDIVRFPPLRGVRRERLRREAEAARARIAEGQPVRLTHVIELPSWRPDGSDALGETARRTSPAVGEAARRFAPNAPVSRLVSPNGAAPGPAAGPDLQTTDPAYRLPEVPKTDPAPPPVFTPQPVPRRQEPPPAKQGPAAEPPLPDASEVLAAMSGDSLGEGVETAPLPAIAPVAPPTPLPAPIARLAFSPLASPKPAPSDFENELRVAPPMRSARRARRWPWFAAAAAAAVGVVWFARARPSADKRNARGPVVERAAPPVEHLPALQPAAAPGPKEPSMLTGKAAQPAATAGLTSGVAPSGVKAGADAYAKALEEGEKLLKHGKYRKAVAELKRAVQVNPESVPALLALADAYLEVDQPRSALQPLEAASRLDANNGRAPLLLGTAYQSLGRNAEAVKAYQHYLELDPGGEFANDVRSILANLRH
jgi:DNA-binding response OmpR family regulator